MYLKIEAFTYSYGNKIPSKYTCDGQEISPGMTWFDVPEESKSFAIVMEGLDTPKRSNPLVLWLIYNIPGNIRKIETGTIPDGTQVGKNDIGLEQYSGPCPTPGPDHQRYLIRLYALDSKLDLDDGITYQDFKRATKDHILDKTEYVATYEKYKK